MSYSFRIFYGFRIDSEANGWGGTSFYIYLCLMYTAIALYAVRFQSCSMFHVSCFQSNFIWNMDRISFVFRAINNLLRNKNQNSSIYQQSLLKFKMSTNEGLIRKITAAFPQSLLLLPLPSDMYGCKSSQRLRLLLARKLNSTCSADRNINLHHFRSSWILSVIRFSFGVLDSAIIQIETDNFLVIMIPIQHWALNVQNFGS